MARWPFATVLRDVGWSVVCQPVGQRQPSAYPRSTAYLIVHSAPLFVLTLFMMAVMLGRVRRMLISDPFKLSWWATSFPLAAAAIAAVRLANAVPSPFSDITALILSGIATLAILILLGRTLWGIASRNIWTMSI
ncbi:MAG: C4-dicarboxylate transporter/malic acid transport family protein [Rubritepida sp.]|nr:C4-dicarboxylate transporter/malic acid transport family protein [Rubritepida sp.]